VSTINRHPQPRFTGYRVDPEKKDAGLFLPGHAGLKSEQSGTGNQAANPDEFVASDVKAEVLKPGQSKPQLIDLVKKGPYWVSKERVPFGTDYRFRVDDSAIHLPQGSVVAKPMKDGRVEKDGGESKPILTDRKNGMWEFANPLPTRGQIQLTLPVSSSKLPWRLERIDEGNDPVGLHVRQKGENWVFTDEDAAADSTYRLSPGLSNQEVRQHGDLGSFNRVSHLEANTPHKSPMIMDVFQDAAEPITGIKKQDQKRRERKGQPLLEGAHVPDLPMHGPHTRPADPQTKPEDGLQELLGIGHAAGAGGVVLKPFTGEDDTSPHGYWPKNPFGLNLSSFSSKDALRAGIGKYTGLNIKMFNDGAFVNASLNSGIKMANLAYGPASPFRGWFQYGDKSPQDKLVLGVLPQKLNRFGEATLDENHLGIRVLNDPESRQTTYNDKMPTYIQLYDTRLEQPDGKPIPNADPKILNSSETVQRYQFIINPKELKGKDRHRLTSMLEWSNFRLGLPSEDNSGAKWDGKIDAAMLNTRNPEVVNYLKGAVTYWTRLAMNTNVRNVTHAMLQEQGKTLSGDSQTSQLSPVELIAKITQNGQELKNIKSRIKPHELLNNPDFKRLLKDKPLPPVINAEMETLDKKKLQHIYDSVMPDHAEAKNGQAFAQRLLKEVPMSVLPLPSLFKADFAYPGLERALTAANRGKFARFMSETVLDNLARIPVLGRIFRSIRNALFPRPFQEQLGKKMQDIFQYLSPDLQENLRYGNVQSLLADKVGEVLYLSLFTGLQPNEVQRLMKDPKALEKAFYKGMPAHILKSDPVTASKFIPAFLSKRLKELSPQQMGNLVQAEVSQLDPRLAAVAEAVLNQRELGLNWRIDAAKDVANMNRIKEAPDHERAKVFEEEFGYVMDFWGKLTGAIRDVFPKTAIIPELTDLELLSGADRQGEMGRKGRAALKRVKERLFNSGVFNGSPNMSYMFSNPLLLGHYAADPTQFGQSQIDPGKFMDIMREYVESLPAPVTHQMQNMLSSHDFPTVTQILMMNPQLFHMDRDNSSGLKEAMTVALDELQQKVCFAPERKALQDAGIDLDGTFQKLWDHLNSNDLQASLKDKELKAYFNKAAKTAPGSSSKRPTPPELKGKFVDAVFDASNNLGLTDAGQISALKKAIKDRINEPGEAKAMRAVIVNATEQFIEKPQVNRKPFNLSQDEAKWLRNALWPALNAATANPEAGGWGRHFGYQPPDFALNHVFEKVNMQAMPESLKREPERLEQIKLGLYQIPLDEAMNKLQRIIASQVAIPGMPSVYAQDLLAGGGADLNNEFLGNRNIIRTDKLGEDVPFIEHFNQMKPLTNARNQKDMQALNDGEILPLTPDDQSGILPVLRDNGKQQVLTLVNVGTMPKIESEDDRKEREKAGLPQPLQPLDWLHKVGQGKTYSMPERIVRSEKDLKTGYRYQPNLSEVGHDQTTTQYRDPNSQEVFVLNKLGHLHPQGKPNEGVSVPNWRILVREQAPHPIEPADPPSPVSDTSSAVSDISSPWQNPFSRVYSWVWGKS
jgi:glycosidase